MSTMFFKHEKISAEDYVSVVRHMYVFKTMIHLYNNTFFIKVTDDGLTYSNENGLSLSEIDYMSDVVVDKDLLLRYVKSFKYEAKVNVLEVLQSLYNTISFSIVDYEELSKAFLHTNIAPNFVYIREFKSQTTYEKLKLITMCQELINYLDRYDDEEMVVP